MSDPPPPYFSSVPRGHNYTSDGSAQSPPFPGSVYQSFPQTCETDHYYYQGPLSPPEAYTSQPPYQGYYSGPATTSFYWDDPETYGDPPKQPVFTTEQPRDDSGTAGDSRGRAGGVEESFLAACSAMMCCCCLWNMLSQCL